MSALVMGLVWELPKAENFGRAEKNVLLAYADHADSTGRNIYPSIEKVSEKTFYEERAVQMATRKLEKAGYLIADGVSPYGTNRWRIPLETTSEGGAKIAGGAFYAENLLKNAPEGNAPEPSLIKPLTTTTTGDKVTAEIYRLYGDEFGALTPIISEQIGGWIDDQAVPNQWIIDAMRQAVVRNARSWSYVEAILKPWKAKGAKDTRAKGGMYGNSNNRTGGSKATTDQPAEYTDADRAAAERVRKRKAERGLS